MFKSSGLNIILLFLVIKIAAVKHPPSTTLADKSLNDFITLFNPLTRPTKCLLLEKTVQEM